MVRELLLAQSSDWGFLMRMDPSREYAEQRAREHLSDFDRIREILTKDDDGRLDEIEQKHPIFPDLPWNLFEAYE
jgi:1,4-alpha-glucan branching enzyme